MYDRKDPYYKKAKQEGYKSRAAYKLKEIDKKYNLYHQNSRVLDAGCAPGGWSQVLLERVKNGVVVGVDILEMDSLNHPAFHFIHGDITEDETVERILEISDKYDLVVSDAAPNTSGQKLLDHVNSVELVQKIAELTRKVLKKKGTFLFKLFEGEDKDMVLKGLRKDFDMVKVVKPDATRKNSFEIYVICRGYKGEQG
ncbi:RlmE family RNA methyltransferase [Limisalsivibrio acetivorans]|uniref:RlmE family RNA methyltransferase n=1 Tax=Limisalsivibrio acetivorans TaxID=1304888 RepID=UPI0003B33265|nr:RlmE family RNA methyltransferase [Limisalsivibrio acetivorans]